MSVTSEIWEVLRMKYLSPFRFHKVFFLPGENTNKEKKILHIGGHWEAYS